MAELKNLIVEGDSRLIGDTNAGKVTATSFVKSGGTSAQFLKADGTVDSNAYSTTSHTHSAATTAANGFMSSGDKTKLDGIASGATAVSSGTVANWGFTKNAGTITGINMNGASKGTSGVVDLGTVITAHRPLGTGNTDAASGSHTHSTSIATSTGTNQITLTASTKYVLNAGGTSYVFTTPADTNTWRPIGTGNTDAASGSHTHATSIATSTGTNQITLAASTKYAITAGGTSYIFTTPPNTTYGVATTASNGLMSSTDKTRLNKLGQANYGTTGTTSKIKINITSETSWMLSFVVTLYQGYISTKVMISGYQYGSNHWYSPRARIIGQSDLSAINVYFGYDANNKLWVGFDGGSYTGVSISDVTNGFTQIDDYTGLFSISNVSSLATLQSTVVAYGEGWSAAPTSGQVIIADGTNGAFKTSGFTIGKSVPSDAKFTDTTYSNATTASDGLMASASLIKLNGIAAGATAVTSGTVSGWGFTKNAGTITGITMNGASKGTSGNVDLGTVITAHRPLGTGSTDACAGNDSRLSDARPASDVYAWAKAASKPSYSWEEITGKPNDLSRSSNMTLTTGNEFVKNTDNQQWNGQVYSKLGYKECRITYKIGQTNAYIMVGLNSDPTTDANYASIDYCWYTLSGGQLTIFENGTSISSISGHTTYTTGDELIVEYSNGAVRYYHNGVLCRSVSRSYGTPLYFDSSFYTVGGKIYDAYFEPIHNDSSVSLNGSTLTVKINGVEKSLTNTTYSAATTTSNGLMASASLIKLNGIASGATAVNSGTVSGWGYTKNTGDVVGPASATSGTIAIYDGTTGKKIKDSGFTIGKSVPSDAKFTDTTYSVATTTSNGLMTSASLIKLNSIASGAQVPKSGNLYLGQFDPDAMATSHDFAFSANNNGDVEISIGVNYSNANGTGISITPHYIASGSSYNGFSFDLNNPTAASGSYALGGCTAGDKYNWNSKESPSNKVTSISSASTDTQYPSAKCVYTLVGNIEAALAALR